jgi:hypothetical protein
MDVHSGFVGVTAPQFKEAYERDLAIEKGRWRPFRARLARIGKPQINRAARRPGGVVVKSLRQRARALEYRPEGYRPQANPHAV